MDSKFSFYPKFNWMWNDSPSTPKWRLYQLFGFKLLSHFFNIFLEFPKALKWCGLFWCPCSYSAISCPWIKIFNTFLLWNQFHLSFDPNLPLQRLPVKTQSRFRVTLQFLWLSWPIIGVKYKTSFIVTLQKNNPGTRIQILITGSQAHLIIVWYVFVLSG